MSIPDRSTLVDQLAGHREQLTGAAASLVDATIERVEAERRPGLDGPAVQPDLEADALAALIDHTQLNPEATAADIQQACAEAERYQFASVCIPPSFVEAAAERLAETSVAVCTVLGFPMGYTFTAAKAHEAEQALDAGATELDMVLPIGRLRGAAYADVEADIRAVVDAARAHASTTTVKVILETALLNDLEKAVACVIAERAGADFVKTSTGFASGGAKADDVALMRHMVGDALGVKASGGVRSPTDVQRMVAHGASRIGASGSVAIMEGLTAATDY
jgi:deoxyribose-phosphate aldolase